MLTAIMACVAIPTALASATRLPRWRERRNLRIMLMGTLTAASFALMIPSLYATLDTGHHNALDLLIKGVLFLALNIVCGDLAAANGADKLSRWAATWPGWLLYGLFMAAITYCFLQVRTSGSSPALEANLDQPWAVAYNTIANFYPVAIGVALAPALLRTLTAPLITRRRRISSALVLGGFTIGAVGALMLPLWAGSLTTYRLDQALNGICALTVIGAFVRAYFAYSPTQHGNRLFAFEGVAVVV